MGGFASASEMARRLVSIPTVNPPGDEAAAQRYLASLFETAGLDLEVLETAPGRPNLVARLPGSGDRPALILHGHVDVVGVSGQPWDHPPFEAVVADGILHGRGALDMKSGVAIFAQALIRAAGDGVLPSGDVVLIVAVDSETGGEVGMQHVLAEHPDIVAGAAAALGEFGGFPLYAFGRKFYRIGVSQKQYVHLRLRLRGEAGHGSSVATDTVVGALGRALARLDRVSLPYHRTPLTEQIIEAMAAAVPASMANTLHHLLDPGRFEEAIEDLGEQGETFESLFRDTANPTIVRSGEKFNVIPSEATVEIDARLLPGRTVEELAADLGSLVGDEELIVEVLASGPPAEPGFDPVLFETLASILVELDPSGIPIPYLFNESPDGRLFAEHGIQHYGYVPMDLPPDLDLPRLIHAPNERVPLAAIEFGAEAIYRLIRRY